MCRAGRNQLTSKQIITRWLSPNASCLNRCRDRGWQAPRDQQRWCEGEMLIMTRLQQAIAWWHQSVWWISAKVIRKCQEIASLISHAIFTQAKCTLHYLHYHINGQSHYSTYSETVSWRIHAHVSHRQRHAWQNQGTTAKYGRLWYGDVNTHRAFEQF